MRLDSLRTFAHALASTPQTESSDSFLLRQFNVLLSCLLNAENFDSSADNREAFELCLKCLTNLCSSSHRNELLFRTTCSGDRCTDFVTLLKRSFFEATSSSIRSATTKLLCNLTRDDIWSSQFFNVEQDRWLKVVLSSNIDSIPLLLNMSCIQNVRRWLCESREFHTRLLDSFKVTNPPENTLLFAGVLKNCCFEDDYHPQLIGPESLLLETILRPLCGPEDTIDPDDKQKLPISLQELVGNPATTRCESLELKATICHALLQLCATSWGRTQLRSVGTYFILRELHKFEQSALTYEKLCEAEKMSRKSLLFDIEQVVDQLICEEHERDESVTKKSLREVEVGKEFAQTFEQTRAEFIGSVTTE